MPSMVAVFVPWIPVVHSIPVAMSVLSFLLFSSMFIFSPRSLHRTSTSRSTSALRIRRPTSIACLFSLITVKSVGSRLLSDVVAVVFPRSRSFFVVSSSGRTSSSFTFPFSFVWAFVAAFRLASANTVRTDWYAPAVTPWSASTSAACRASRTAPRTAIDGGSAATACSGDWTEM